MSLALAAIRFACPADLTEVALALPDRDSHRLRLAACGLDDEELHVSVGPHAVVIRRVHCVISDGLLRGDDAPDWELSPQAKAALLWRAFRRYDQLVGVKRLTGGLSGSDVLVFRPRLRSPALPVSPHMASAGPTDVLDRAWGSPLLVKTGPADAVRQEWERSETFLRDRQSPFLVRNEELLDVRPVGRAEPPRATLIGSFLGGDVVRAEPLDKLIRGCRDATDAIRAIDAAVGHLATWHTNPSARLLARWPRAFRFAAGSPPDGWPEAGTAAPWLLFGRFHFRKRHADDKAGEDAPRPDTGGPSLGRAEFARGVGWDIAFGSTAHLAGHLLGPAGRQDGLLHRLAAVPALFSLVHGDLNPRNVLCDPDKVWLIDFQHTGVGPVLADLAKLEANLRLWCVELTPTGDATAAARRLEQFLLAHFHGGECSLEPVRKMAGDIGADPDDLEKIARCVLHVRQLARKWCVPEFADGRDYLAVLYLTVMSLLPHAGAGHTGTANERWAVELCWVLEAALDRALGREPFDRGTRAYDPAAHVSVELVRDAGAPRRVEYLCSTADGQLAIQPVAALRGVLQGGYHHLDAYQHTLSVLAHVEALLEDPVGRLLDPAALDAAVAERFREYGLAVPPPGQETPARTAADWLAPHHEVVANYLAAELTDDARLALKWSALLHDVGKPGTRTVRERDGRLEVQFLGHERYGTALLRSRLAAWFPDPHAATGRRVEALIHNHHRSHQLIGDYFARTPDAAADLFALVAGESRPGVLSWLQGRFSPGREEYRPDMPLLLLHGFADRMSARGVRQGGSVGEWAAVTLGLLAYLARADDLAGAEARRAAGAAAESAAAVEYAAELLAAGCFGPKEQGRAVGALRKACRGREGDKDELLRHLRETVPCDELVRRLREGRN